MAKRGSVEKEAIIARMIEVRQKILDTAMKLPPEQQKQPFLGDWTLKDLLAHLAGWDATNAAAVGQILSGAAPDFLQHRDKDWRTYNQFLVEEFGQGTIDEVINRVRQSHRSLITVLGSTPDSDFNTRVAHGKRSLSIGSLLDAEIRDEWEHLDQLCDFFQASQETGQHSN